MGPAELAALVAREADAGVAGALRALDAAGVLTVETVTGRIGSRPDGAQTPWEDITWLAEVTMRPGHVVRAAGPDDPTGAPAPLPTILADLPVRAVQGVGPAWERTLHAREVRTIGALASLAPGTVAAWSRTTGGAALLTLVARARTCGLPWPTVDPGDTRSVLDVAHSDPGDVAGWPPGSRSEAHALWSACLTLTSALDDAVLRGIRVNGSLGGPAR